MEEKKMMLKNMIFRALDNLINKCIEVFDAYKVESSKEPAVYLISLNMIANLTKLSETGEGKLDRFITQYNNIIENIYKTCKNKASNQGDKFIPISFLKSCVDVVKSNFKIGLENN